MMTELGISKNTAGHRAPPTKAIPMSWWSTPSTASSPKHMSIRLLRLPLRRPRAPCRGLSLLLRYQGRPGRSAAISPGFLAQVGRELVRGQELRCR